MGNSLNGGRAEGWTFSVLFSPTHNPVCGNLLHSKPSGHWNPNLFMSTSQPFLACSHRDLHGGIASSRTVQTGTYIAQRKNFKYGLHWTFTRGKNWLTSKPASFWVWWFSRFGMIVILYWISLHIGIDIGSHLLWVGRFGSEEPRLLGLLPNPWPSVRRTQTNKQSHKNAAISVEFMLYDAISYGLSWNYPHGSPASEKIRIHLARFGQNAGTKLGCTWTSNIQAQFTINYVSDCSLSLIMIA